MKFITLLYLLLLSSFATAEIATGIEGTVETQNTEGNGNGGSSDGSDDSEETTNQYTHDFTASFTQKEENKKYVGKIGDVTPAPAWFTHMDLTLTSKTIKLSFILSDGFEQARLDVDNVSVNNVFLSDGEYVGTTVPRLRYVLDESEAEDLLEDSVIIPERDSLSLKFTEVTANKHYRGTEIADKPTWLKGVDILLGGRSKKILLWINENTDTTNLGSLSQTGLIAVNGVALSGQARLISNKRFLIIITDSEASSILENNTIRPARQNFNVDFSINTKQTKYTGDITSPSPAPSWLRSIDIRLHSQTKLLIWVNRNVTLSDLGEMGNHPILISINNVAIGNPGKVITSSNGNVKRLLFIITQDELSNILGN